jgi:hypothetical protein
MSRLEVGDSARLLGKNFVSILYRDSAFEAFGAVPFAPGGAAEEIQTIF